MMGAVHIITKVPTKAIQSDAQKQDELIVYGCVASNLFPPSRSAASHEFEGSAAVSQ